MSRSHWLRQQIGSHNSLNINIPIYFKFGKELPPLALTDGIAFLQFHRSIWTPLHIWQYSGLYAFCVSIYKYGHCCVTILFTQIYLYFVNILSYLQNIWLSSNSKFIFIQLILFRIAFHQLLQTNMKTIMAFDHRGKKLFSKLSCKRRFDQDCERIFSKLVFNWGHVASFVKIKMLYVILHVHVVAMTPSNEGIAMSWQLRYRMIFFIWWNLPQLPIRLMQS